MTSQTQLPEVVERLSDVYYHRGSPYSGFGKETTDREHGDLHQVRRLPRRSRRLLTAPPTHH